MIQISEETRGVITRVRESVSNYKEANAFISEMLSILQESRFYEEYSSSSTNNSKGVQVDKTNDKKKEELKEAVIDFMILDLNKSGKASCKEIDDISNTIKSISTKEELETISEAFLDSEGKLSIGIELDSSGNLLIKKGLNLDYAGVYAQSNRMIEAFKSTGNIEGVKYELAKQWYLLYLLENRVIFNKNKLRAKFITDTKREDALRVRSFILSNFKNNLSWIYKKDREFTFNEYFKLSPFYKETYKIDKTEIAKFVLNRVF